MFDPKLSTLRYTATVVALVLIFQGVVSVIDPGVGSLNTKVRFVESRSRWLLATSDHADRPEILRPSGRLHLISLSAMSFPRGPVSRSLQRLSRA